jgi:hypothetical protein
LYASVIVKDDLTGYCNDANLAGIYLSIHLSIYPSVYQSVYQSIYLTNYLSIGDNIIFEVAMLLVGSIYLLLLIVKIFTEIKMYKQIKFVHTKNREEYLLGIYLCIYLSLICIYH